MTTIIDGRTGQIVTFADFRRERYELRMQAILNYAPQPGGPWVASWLFGTSQQQAAWWAMRDNGECYT